MSKLVPATCVFVKAGLCCTHLCQSWTLCYILHLVDDAVQEFMKDLGPLLVVHVKSGGRLGKL